ncbi:MAG: glycosyltransferase family 4 protein [Planctomycetota bacterium]|jgi:glycosyltransferase involved in cell wall biosynthesis
MSTREQLIDDLIQAKGITPRLAEADGVICMSEVLKAACTRAGVSEERITVLGNRVSTTRFQPQPYDGDPHTIRALFVGRLDPVKNIDGIAGALARLKQQGWNVHLDVCGGPGVNAYLRESLSVLAPADWSYRGTVPNRELPRRYAAADMYVGPSRHEGFQIPLIEALACGRPCVASRQPPALEILDATTGVLVDPGNPAAIAAGIAELKQKLNDPSNRAAIFEACRRAAVDRWSLETISAREAKLYLDVLAR